MIDYITETKDIIEYLKSIDQIEIGCKLEDAIRSGSTGTEIAMGIKYYLFILGRKTEIKDVNMKERIFSLSEYLEKMLK
jgi:hypothetical protein